uniref:Uncharacterized protein n=1 Tax=Arundo donax TaxID=35708 RepID=A0A0A9G5J6_ARUDO
MHHRAYSHAARLIIGLSVVPILIDY